jgi:Flp pilus assembly protein TadG
MATSRNRRGIALAWTAIVLFVMIGIVGLSIDWGKVVWNVHQMQNAADAGALAGAQIVKADHSGAITRTHDFAIKNWADQLPVILRTTTQTDPFSGDESGLDIILGRWVRLDHTFFATLDAPNAVKVIARRGPSQGAGTPSLVTVFSPIFTDIPVDANRVAIACCFDSGGSGLICLSRSAVPGLYISGTGDIDVQGGGIHVNSTVVGNNSNAGSWIQGGANIDCGQLNVVGGIDPPPEDGRWANIFTDKDGTYHPFTVNDITNAEVAHIDDPVKATMLQRGDLYVDPVAGDRLDLPTLIDNGTFPTRQVVGEGSIGATTRSLPPGYYPYGINLTKSNVTITLDPKADATYTGPPIYIFGGAGGSNSGLYVNGGNLIGNGVTCYVTKSYGFGDLYGVTRLMGNGIIHLTSPGDLSDTDSIGVDGRPGIAVWQDPANPNYVHLNGGGDLRIQGTLYFPDPIHARLEGNLGEAGNQILCGSADILGKAVINVNYDGRNDPFQSNTSRLVK